MDDVNIYDNHSLDTKSNGVRFLHIEPAGAGNESLQCWLEIVLPTISLDTDICRTVGGDRSQMGIACDSEENEISRTFIVHCSTSSTSLGLLAMPFSKLPRKTPMQVPKKDRKMLFD